MFAFIDWYIKLLTAVLGWGSFLFIGLTGGVRFCLSRNAKSWDGAAPAMLLLF